MFVMSCRSLRWLAFPLLIVVFGGPVAADGDELTPLDRFFRGKITALKKGIVTLHYDFSTKEQLEDWYEAIPFPIKRLEDQGVEWTDERLDIHGNTATRHVAEWKGDLTVRCRLVLDATQDVGALLTPGPDTNDFAMFSLVEKYFHRWDRKPGGQHSIIKFGDEFRKRGFGGEFVGFRYIARRPPAKPLISGRSIPIVFGLKRGKLFMEVQDQKLQGKDIGVKLKVHRPGFYTVKGRIQVDDVEITGRLDPAWLQACGVNPELEKPIEEDDD